MKTNTLILAAFTFIAAFAYAAPTTPTFDLKNGDVTKIEMVLELKGASEVTLTLGTEAQSSFAVFTKANIGQKVDLIVDGKVVASPMVTSSISGPKITVTCSHPKVALKIADSLVPESK